MTAIQRRIRFLVVLVSLNLLLFYAAIVMEIPLWVIGLVSATGGAIGIVSKKSGSDAVIRALAGSAIAIANIFVFMMSIFARLLGPW